MKDVSVESLAAEIQIPVDRLIQQFADAGINKTVIDSVTRQEKETLLAYLNQDHSSASNKLTLQRKKRSTLSIPSTGGRNKSVQLEVRKKRTYVQHDFQVQEKSEAEKIIHETELLVQQQSQSKTDKQLQNNTKDKIYHTDKDKVNCDLNEQEKGVTKKSDILVNQPTDVTVMSPKKIKKTSLEVKTLELKYRVEQETRLKIKEKTHQIVEDAPPIIIAKELSYNWDGVSELVEEDSNDYHVTTSYHAREAEDENDRKAEYDRRHRVRSNSKLTKQKKANRLYETKNDREEARVVNRGVKTKRKPSTLTQGFNKPVQSVNRDVTIGETITVAELANKMAVKGSHVIKVMMKLGALATINQVIDQETAQLIAEEMGHKVILRRENELEESLMSDRVIGNFTVAESRAPVVTIMGHVDHGKTSLLDYIRSTKVAAGEAGSITQHIGAYHVETNNGMITFLDTPGHAAFTAMRARGVQVTDIVVLVVAIDDGVMPQTIEAIQHARAANVPIVVALNKIDKPEGDPERIKNELTQYGIVPEEWGGENQFICVSAKTGAGINELLDAILLQAEVLELKAIRSGMANGVVIESSLDKGRGPVATILVREGTLNRGDIVLCGFEYGRIRAIRNEVGRDMLAAGPSIPIEILGLSGVPVAGDEVTVVRDEKKAREVALYRQGKFREVKLTCQKKSNVETMFSNMNERERSELNIVLKSNAQGSVEAIKDALEMLSTEEVKVKIIGSGVGYITETDAMLAAASNAILLGFNVRADASARRFIELENLDLRYYSVIYDVIDEVKKAMNGMLEPTYKQKIIGLAEVRDVFHSLKFGAIAGCMVTEGMVKRHNRIRVLRENIVIYEGELESLRRFKDDVNEVRNGMECGIGVKNYSDVRPGDVIEVFETIELQRTIA